MLSIVRILSSFKSLIRETAVEPVRGISFIADPKGEGDRAIGQAGGWRDS